MGKTDCRLALEFAIIAAVMLLAQWPIHAAAKWVSGS